MERLTANINGEIVIPKKNIVKGDLSPFFGRLGQLEDILEKHHINNLDDLDRRLTFFEEFARIKWPEE